MKIYLVGGAVRDGLLGIDQLDQDYVVVGAYPQMMLDLGFVPVGKDFPVFLHPQTKAEYALARIERKIAKGYKGFEVDCHQAVTLEEDLARRDLTINAMAREVDSDGHLSTKLIDPFGGQEDLKQGIFRHVSPAFAEDPVRILRLARFAARWPNFSVAPETTLLMTDMVNAGEVDHLVQERVWQEIARGLMETRPSRLFEVLASCGALARLLPELDVLRGVPQLPDYHPEIDTWDHTMLCIDEAAKASLPLCSRFALLCHEFGKGATPPERWPRHSGHELASAQLTQRVSERLIVPTDVKQFAVLYAQYHGRLHRAAQMKAQGLLEVLTLCDAFRRPARFTDILNCAQADFYGRLGNDTQPYPQAQRLSQALTAASQVDVGSIAKAHETPQIQTAIAQARLQAIKTQVFDHQ